MDYNKCILWNTSIGEWAFSGCAKLERIDLSGCTSLTYIDHEAFLDCRALTSLKFPSSLKSIGRYNGDALDDGAFQGCTKLATVDFSECTLLEIIGQKTFSGCAGLTEVTLPASLIGIGESAFSDCTKLERVDLSGCTSLIGIGGKAFNGCTKLERADLAATKLTEIEYQAFYGCAGLTEVSLPANLTSIGREAFNGCTKLERADLAATKLTKIEDSTFYGCAGLTEVSLPANLTSIGEKAFSGCAKLTSAIFADTTGWAVYNDWKYNDKQADIQKDELANPAKAAEYLRDTYCRNYWKKN